VEEVRPPSPPAVIVAALAERPAPALAAEPAEAVVRVTAQSLNRLMSLAGESLVQARWLQPFSTALLKLKKHQDHLAELLESVAHALAAGRNDQAEQLAAEARRQAGHCRQVLVDRMAEFEDHAAQAERLNTRLYDEVIVSRMRPFADGAQGFPRLVRDMARKLDKQVRLDLVGPATPVDRDILEKLEAPLTHLLRNAVDHGIEPPDERRAAGKPELGTITLEARHRAGMLAIVVADDGGGIELPRLRRKIIEKGLSTAEMVESMTEAELLEFLFLPGFSTASSLTEFSGRGVGLDVVQDTVRRVGGSVRVSTRLGQGTTFHLQLPLTLSVVRAVLVDIAGEPYAFPHNRIDRLLRVPAAAVRSLENRQFATVDGQNVGLVVAAQLFDLPLPPPSIADFSVVLLSDVSGTYGLIVDAFRGEQDLVVRQLDPRLGKVPNVSAAAILDDGAPVLVADVEDMARSMDQFIRTGTLRRLEKKNAAQAARKRILVVDDSITVRETERQLLRARGYDVAVAVDGQEGWNVLQAERFDLVVTDVDMPRMNGLELVRAMRQNGAWRDVPVVIISYKDREEDRLRGLEVGANYYLTKGSFHDNTFLQAVTDLIGEP
jgi:two-component system sensor histidine kinase and response regulator WspE